MFERAPGPSLDGATEWLHSEPLGPADLRGHVVVNFSTFTCSNWWRQLPYIRAWSHAYRDDGLVVGVEGSGVEAAADWQHLRSPETYLGHARGEHFASPGGVVFDERRRYELPRRLRSNHWALAGEWTIGPEKIVLDQAPGTIACRFHARDAHPVLSPGRHDAIPFRSLLDGEAPGPAHGLDTDDDGNGLLRASRLHQLVRQRPEVRKRTLEITFLEPGAEAYVFTYG